MGGSAGFNKSSNTGMNQGQSTSGGFSNQGSSYGNVGGSSIWGPQAGHLQRGLQGAENVYNQGPYQYYPESTVNPLNPLQQTAIGNQFTRGLFGSGPEKAFGNTLLDSLGSQGPTGGASPGALQGYENAATQGNDYLGSTLSGGQNPYLNSQFDQAAGRLGKNFSEFVLPGVNSTFGGAGRTGSPAHERAVANAGQGFGQGLSDLATNLYGNAYETDQNRRLQAGEGLAQRGLQAGGLGVGQYNAQTQRQLGAGALVPGHSGLDVQNINLQQEAGDRLRAQDDATLQDDVNRFYYNQDAPNQQVQRYLQSIGAPIMESFSQGGGSSFGNSQNFGQSTNRGSTSGKSKGTNIGYSSPAG